MNNQAAIAIVALIFSLPAIILVARVIVSPAFDRLLDAMAAAAPFFVWGGVASVIIAMIGGGLYVFGRALASTYSRLVDAKHIWPDGNGQFPIIRVGSDFSDITPESVRLLAAYAATISAYGNKPSAAAVGRLVQAATQPPPLQIPQLAEVGEEVSPDEDDAFDISRINPITSPHWLFIGQTGSGKSTAMFTVLRQLQERYNAEITICEPGGVDWNMQADYIDYDDIANAIEAEYEVMKERQAALRDADVNHISKMPEPLSIRYLVFEEMDSLLDNLSRARASDVIFHLREIARMGRKTGIGLIALSQTALADVFNTHVRGNLNNVFLFRGSQQIARNWGVSKLVDLQSLRPGQAFDLSYERVVKFPMAERPVLRRGSTVPRLGAATMAIGDKTARTAKKKPKPTVLKGPMLAPGRKPDTRTAMIMRMWFNDGVSKSEIARRVWGYKNADVWPFVNDALDGKI